MHSDVVRATVLHPQRENRRPSITPPTPTRKAKVPFKALMSFHLWDPDKENYNFSPDQFVGTVDLLQSK